MWLGISCEFNLLCPRNATVLRNVINQVFRNIKKSCEIDYKVLRILLCPFQNKQHVDSQQNKLYFWFEVSLVFSNSCLGYFIISNFQSNVGCRNKKSELPCGVLEKASTSQIKSYFKSGFILCDSSCMLVDIVCVGMGPKRTIRTQLLGIVDDFVFGFLCFQFPVMSLLTLRR